MEALLTTKEVKEKQRKLFERFLEKQGLALKSIPTDKYGGGKLAFIIDPDNNEPICQVEYMYMIIDGEHIGSYVFYYIYELIPSQFQKKFEEMVEAVDRYKKSKIEIEKWFKKQEEVYS